MTYRILFRSMHIHVPVLYLSPVYEHQQGEAAQPPGQSDGRVQVQVQACGTREQEDLGGLLVGELGGLDRGGVVVNFRLAVRRHIQLQQQTNRGLVVVVCVLCVPSTVKSLQAVTALVLVLYTVSQVQCAFDLALRRAPSLKHWAMLIMLLITFF